MQVLSLDSVADWSTEFLDKDAIIIGGNNWNYRMY